MEKDQPRLEREKKINAGRKRLEKYRNDKQTKSDSTSADTNKKDMVVVVDSIDSPLSELKITNDEDRSIEDEWECERALESEWNTEPMSRHESHEELRNKRLNDLSQAERFAYAMVCALLQKRVDFDWGHAFVEKLLIHLELSHKVRESIQFAIDGDLELGTFTEGLKRDPVKCWIIIQDFLSFSICNREYDSRSRTMLRYLTESLVLEWKSVVAYENCLAMELSEILRSVTLPPVCGDGQGNDGKEMAGVESKEKEMKSIDKDSMMKETVEDEACDQLEVDDYVILREERNVNQAMLIGPSEQQKTGKWKSAQLKRVALVGLASITGALALGLSGGFAAPFLASSLASAGVTSATGAAFFTTSGGAAVCGTVFGAAGASLTGYKMAKRTGDISTFQFQQFKGEERMHVYVFVTGWLTSAHSPDTNEFITPWCSLGDIGDQFSLEWETEHLKRLGNALFKFITTEVVGYAAVETLKQTALSSIMTALAWPAVLLRVADFVDNPWSIGMDRAEKAGKLLGEVLHNRTQGYRPVTLAGFSLGARVIFYALKYLSDKHVQGVVENVFLLGTPVSSTEREWLAVQNIVSGRLVNCYANNDWILKFLYRTSSADFTPAGLCAISNLPAGTRIENFDASSMVEGHLSYSLRAFDILKAVNCDPAVYSDFEKNTSSSQPSQNASICESPSLDAHSSSSSKTRVSYH